MPGDARGRYDIFSHFCPAQPEFAGGQRRGNPLVSSAGMREQRSLNSQPAKRWLEELKTAGQSGRAWPGAF
jgi:hypothetical protein